MDAYSRVASCFQHMGCKPEYIAMLARNGFYSMKVQCYSLRGAVVKATQKHAKGERVGKAQEEIAWLERPG